MATVLLASYQGEKYIREQIDSILNQSISGLKLLISDDGSSDSTGLILEEYHSNYPDRIELAPHPAETKVSPDKVPLAAQNFFWLLSQCKDEYAFLSDQDDIWNPDKAEKMLKRMKELEGTCPGGCPILIHSDMIVADASGKEISSSFFSYQNCRPDRKTLAEILVENPVTGGAVLMNRPLMELLRKEPESCCMHDWWIALCAAAFGVIDVMPEPLYRYRQHENNTLGAHEADLAKEIAERPSRQKEVREAYLRMFSQADSFLKQFRDRLKPEDVRTLEAYLTFPSHSVIGRFRMIRQYGFTKSSRLQTIAQCVTVPREA